MDAKFIASILKTQYDNAWIFATEVNTSTGFNSQHQDGPGGIRRIDAFAMALWPSLDFRRVAYEIKVSRSDWLAEIENPMKRVQGWYLSNEFWFAVTSGITEPRDWRRDMNGCGLLIIRKDGHIDKIRRARRRKHIAPMPDGFIASFLRRAIEQNGGKEAQETLVSS